MNEPRPWTDSRTILYLALTWLGGTLLQLVPMLQAKQIDWWALASSAVATLAGVLIRMAQPDIVAPIPALNRSNSSVGLGGGPKP